MLVLALIHDSAMLMGASGGLYAAGVATVAAASVIARSSERRRDARETLRILLRRRAPR
ncbi:hypothetical protein ABZ686_02445 [Streptomyces sp. NPDC006992]|uniref:hypothetical protein n=1 Tax=Streptomyces sp. NPDC006992 TaxID=3155601 RepID=UPI0033DD6FEB